MKRRMERSLLFLAALSLAVHAIAQAPPRYTAQPPRIGIVDDPCGTVSALPASARDLLMELFIEPHKLEPADIARLTNNEDFKVFLTETRERASRDWPNLCRFRAANLEAQAATARPQIVFMGDSITENWALADPELFQDGRLNRGISGQTTPQMLVRFRTDVIALKPKAVHILAGTNDLAGNTGPTRPQDLKDNIMSMTELARAHGIRVILGSIPPAAVFNWRPELKPAPQIRELNSWLEDYAAQQNLEYIDYHAVLAGAEGELKPALGNDGVHPNRAGYRAMKVVLEKSLAKLAR
jgi:lysophospholipase L1-like esterase